MRESAKTAAGGRDESTVPTIRIPAKVYGVMALTTALTFTTLMTGFQLLFPPQSLFA